MLITSNAYTLVLATLRTVIVPRQVTSSVAADGASAPAADTATASASAAEDDVDDDADVSISVERLYEDNITAESSPEQAPDYMKRKALALTQALVDKAMMAFLRNPKGHIGSDLYHIEIESKSKGPSTGADEYKQTFKTILKQDYE